MKKNAENRILGRRVAREMPNEELARAAGSAVDNTGAWTYTLLYPSDPGDPRWDGPSPGPIVTGTDTLA